MLRFILYHSQLQQTLWNVKRERGCYRCVIYDQVAFVAMECEPTLSFDIRDGKELVKYSRMEGPVYGLCVSYDGLAHAQRSFYLIIRFSSQSTIDLHDKHLTLLTSFKENVD